MGVPVAFVAAACFSAAECFPAGTVPSLLQPRLRSAPVAKGGTRVRLRIRSISMGGRGDKDRRSENVEGSLFVDNSCINCDTCRWMAPETFDFIGGMSAVSRQPAPGSAEHDRALAAMVSCPTGSIRAESPPAGMAQVVASFPRQMTEAPDVYHCGYHDAKSFGAASYLLVRPSGNVLVDAPRFNSALAKRIAARGAPTQMFITHSHDCADHAKWRAAFPGMERVVHAREIGGYGAGRSLDECERILHGEGPWELEGGGTLILQPGHTPGGLCLHYEGVLLTGDHLAVTRREGHLAGFPRYAQDWREQVASTEAMFAARRFRAVLPGHGRPLVLDSEEAMEEQKRLCLAWMRAQ